MADGIMLFTATAVIYKHFWMQSIPRGDRSWLEGAKIYAYWAIRFVASTAHSGPPYKLKTHSEKKKIEEITKHENSTKIQIENLIRWIRRSWRVMKCI